MKRKKVLLVDDSVTSIMFGTKVLQNGPYDIITASNGAEGLLKSIEEHPDLILLDVEMPVMDGFQTLKELRSNKETEAIPVIMVTSRGEMEAMETGYGSGCNDYVTKPVDADELLSKVESWLNAE